MLKGAHPLLLPLLATHLSIELYKDPICLSSQLSSDAEAYMPEFTWVWNCMRLNWPLQNWLTLIFARFPRKFVASVYKIYVICISTNETFNSNKPNPNLQTSSRHKLFSSQKRPNSMSAFLAHLTLTNCERIKWNHSWPNSRHSRIDFLCLRQGNTTFTIPVRFIQNGRVQLFRYSSSYL